MAIAEAYVTHVAGVAMFFFCTFYTAAASKMIEAGHLYDINGHDIKYTMNTNIDVEHI